MTDRVVLFDGECDFCNRWVAFVVRRDPDAVFRFASLQSPAGRELMERFSLPTDALDTVVLVDGDVAHTRSTAALEIARRLRGPWRLIGVLRWIPRPVRDFVYDQVARRRHRLGGRRDSCLIPTAELRERFLDGPR